MSTANQWNVARFKSAAERDDFVSRVRRFAIDGADAVPLAHEGGAKFRAPHGLGYTIDKLVSACRGSIVPGLHLDDDGNEVPLP